MRKYLISGSALLRPDWSAVTVVAPAKPGTTSAGERLAGDGWTLLLEPEWRVVPAQRSGDFTIQGPARGLDQVN
jgi:hypothetical protein